MMRAYRRRQPPDCSHAHPLVREIVRIAHRERLSDADLLQRAGVHKGAMKDWRCRSVPSLEALDAVAGVLGYQLALRRIPDRD